MEPKKLLLLGIFWLSTLIFGGTLGYIIIEGANPFDALYMTVITITTIGYEEYVPLSTAGRIFTIFLALGGVGFFFYILAVFSEIVVKNTVENLWGKKMEKQIAKLKDHCILCGFGRIGRYIYEFIHQEIPMVVIEKNSEILKELKEKGILHLEGDATSEEILIKAGIERAKYLVAVLGEDAENVYIVLTARNLNPQLYIVARADNPRVEKKLLQAGANRVLSPYVIGARKMALSLLKPNVMDFMEIASPELQMDLQIEEIFVEEGSTLAHKTILESKIREQTNAIILAIKRRSGEMVFNPSSQEKILPGDILIALGERKKLEILSDLAKKLKD
ncbi:potassium transporter TrkA [Caldimicrobium thiodismutans]|uniref:Potassium transporter TrkA n=1 Tax=Caldimicrobium thiodismutans TaxID=1653476 RepID=A0A0U5BZ27_9BACT|nr:potassium channel protein [Caldimicrobium thiodismutans]BAU24069.1 potassium transporter TrkA [Caldimicrobium thiodismutans]